MVDGSLEHLAPYVATSHIRDTAAWEHPRGAALQWVAMGDGAVDWATLLESARPRAVFDRATELREKGSWGAIAHALDVLDGVLEVEERCDLDDAADGDRRQG